MRWVPAESVTAPGWYWYRHDLPDGSPARVRVVQVVASPGGLLRLADDDGDPAGPYLDDLAYGTEFAGPLPEPEG